MSLLYSQTVAAQITNKMVPVDTIGRRRLCLITFPLMCVFLLAAGLSLLAVPGINTPEGPPAVILDKSAKLGPIVLYVI